jgi:hypothetical protein
VQSYADALETIIAITDEGDEDEIQDVRPFYMLCVRKG